MLLNKLVLLFYLLLHTVAFNNVIKDLIVENFNNSYIICYFQLDYNLDYLNKVLMQLYIPIYLLNNTNVYNKCKNIIITIKTSKDFIEFVDKNHFKSHSKMLLFVEETKNITINNEKLIKLAELNAFDVIFVQYIQQQVGLSLKNTENFEITSILGEKERTKFDSHLWSPRIWSKYNQTIRIALFHCPPYVMVNDETHQLDGIEVQLLNDITKNWPIQYIIDKEVNGIRKNMFISIIEMTQRNETDIAVCSLWQRVIQERELDMTGTVSTICLTYLVARPKIMNSSTFIAQPFENRLWLACFGFILLMTILLTSFNYILFEKPFIPSLQVSFMYVLRYFSLGAVETPRKCRSIQYLLTCWCCFCLILSVYYAAGVTILFQFPRYTNNINSYEDIVRMGLNWEEPLDDIRKWLRNTGDPLYSQLADLYLKNDNRTEMNERLRYNNFVFMVKVLKEKYVMNAEELDDYNRLHMKLIPDCLANFYSVIAFKKNSPLVKIFDRKIKSFVEYGLINYWHRMFANRVEFRYMKLFFMLNEQDYLQEFDLPKLQGSFYLLTIGYLLALFVFFVECLLSSTYGLKRHHRTVVSASHSCSTSISASVCNVS